MNTNIKPIGDRLLVKPLDPVEKVGSILIPDEYKEARQEGIIVAAGPKADPALAVGKKVLMAKYGGSEIEAEGQRLIFVHEKDIIALLD